MRLSLPEPIAAALPILKRLHEQQFDAVFVGGAVRDTLLHLPIKDVDIATSARPEQVLQLFERCIPTGLEHGTITVVYDGINYEVTTYRQESAYEAYRKPESVLYITELEGDLLRRDFTMNAMAFTADGELIDPYGGLQDMNDRMLRCVGEADARFQEDALRMLRAVRFIGVYHLRPAKLTWRALIRHRALMKHIAMERVQAELDKMLAGEYPQRAIYVVAASGLLLHLKEQLPSEVEQWLRSFHSQNDYSLRFSGLNQLSSLDVRWAAMWLDSPIGLEEVRMVHRLLRFSNNRSKRIEAIIAIHHEMSQAAVKLDKESLIRNSWLRVVISWGASSAADWLAAAGAIQSLSFSGQPLLLQRCAVWLEEMPINKLKQLNVTGSDLTKHLNYKPGPWLSEWLNRLLLMTACGELDNERTKLLDQAQLWMNEEPNDE